MRLALTLAAAVLITGPAVVALAPPAHAQTSFGEIGMQRPGSVSEWGALLRVNAARKGRDAVIATRSPVEAGRIEVVITVALDGTIKSVERVRSSFDVGTDTVILDALRGMDHMPPFPPDMSGRDVRLHLPIAIADR